MSSEKVSRDRTQASSTGLSVLVVEDDPDQQDLVCETIKMHFDGDGDGDTHIVGVGTGVECMALNLCDFDIILLDYNLPDTTGIDLLKQIISVCDIPVIFVTGNSDAATAAEAIRRGAQDYIVKLGDYLLALPVVVEKNLRQYELKRENARLQKELTASLEQTRIKNIQLGESLQKLQTMAATDHLTGLSNRRAFSDILNRYYGQAIRYGFDLTCIMCDLDDYKALNDTLGHQVGDKVLVAAADVIRSTIRDSDDAARYGGDEFVMLFPHTAADIAIGVADRIRRQIVSATSRHAGNGMGLTLSMGVASLNLDKPDSADALVAMADRALYVAKDRGKNRIVTFDQISAHKEAISLSG